MRGTYVLAAILVALVVCMPAQGAVIYQLTFDHGVALWPLVGPADYTAAPNEILPPNFHGVQLNTGEDVITPNPDHHSGDLISSDGTQGGQALNLMLGGAWPNKQGYFFGRDPVAAGDNYGTKIYGPYTDAEQIGDPGPIIADEFTIEAVVRADYSGCPWGKTSVMPIYDSGRLDDPWDGVSAGAGLCVNQRVGYVTFGVGRPSATVYSGSILQQGRWYHLAGILRPGPSRRVELWIDGVLDGYAEPELVYNFLPGYFTIGTQYWPMSTRNFQGAIDAVAISDKALDPTNWVLHTHQDPGLTAGDAKRVGEGQSVKCTAIVTAAFTDSFYVEDPDRCNGIMVSMADHKVKVGDKVSFTGTKSTLSSGEGQIQANTLLWTAAVSPLEPVAMNNKALGGGVNNGGPGITGASGLSNIGLLVKAYGTVSSSGTNDFRMDDGSGVPLRVELPADVTAPSAGMFVTVVGISSCEQVEGKTERLVKAVSTAQVAPQSPGVAFSNLNGSRQIWLRSSNFSARSTDGGSPNFVSDQLASANALSGGAYQFALHGPIMSGGGWGGSSQLPWWVEYEIPASLAPDGFDLDNSGAGKQWAIWCRVTQPLKYGWGGASSADSNWIMVNGDPCDFTMSDPTDDDWWNVFSIPSDDPCGPDAHIILNQISVDNSVPYPQPNPSFVPYKFLWWSGDGMGAVQHKTFKVIDGKVTFRIYEREAALTNAMIDVICWADDDGYMPTDADIMAVPGW